MAFVTDSNRPQPLWQPPPTACLTASGAASEVPSLLMHPWGTPPGFPEKAILCCDSPPVEELPEDRPCGPLHCGGQRRWWVLASSTYKK